ncbi:hypothetical protein ACI49Z_003573 [Cronobacter turicensis]
MEDKKAVSRLLVCSSVGLMLLLGGWASFREFIPVGVPGLKLTSLQVAPYILTAFWLFFWFRFYVLSRHEDKPEIDKLISEKINSNPNNNQHDLIRSVFPPSKYGLKIPVVVRRWAWQCEELPVSAPLHYVVYQRNFCKRLFMFNYMGNDYNDAALFVHVGHEAVNIHNGVVKLPSSGYFKCLFFEVKCLVKLSFEKPIIVSYYAPHLLAWFCLFYSSYYVIRLYTHW